MKLPLTYDNYIFDLYGTLVDIHTDESDTAIWEKLAMFYGYYGALYEAKEVCINRIVPPEFFTNFKYNIKNFSRKDKEKSQNTLF